MSEGLSLEEATRLNSIEFRQFEFLSDPVGNLAPSGFKRELVPIEVANVYGLRVPSGRYENPLHTLIEKAGE